MEEAGIGQITGIIMGLVARYQNEFQEVAADIGGGGNYLNPKLRDDHRITVRDVDFAQQKEAAVAAMNVFSESGQLVIPDENALFLHQAKNWKRQAGRIAKGNDHLMDTAVCYFAKFIDQLGLNHIRVPPKSINTNSAREDVPGSMVVRTQVARGRVPVFRSLGRKR